MGVVDEHVAILRVLNVGQGDSLVMRLVGGEIIVTDCHTPKNATSPPSIACLEDLAQSSPRKGCERYDIDVLCLTHPDRDHYSGMTALLDWIEGRGGRVKNLVLSAELNYKVFNAECQTRWRELQSVTASNIDWQSNLPFFRLKKGVTEFTRLLTALGKLIEKLPEGGQIYRACQFAPVKSFGNTRVYILGPTGTTVERHKKDIWKHMLDSFVNGTMVSGSSTNELSCILWVLVGKAQVLLTGDTTNEACAAAVTAYETNHQEHVGETINLDIVKAAHHGSRTGCSLTLLQRMLRPGKGNVIISSGRGYGHPHCETLDQLKEASVLGIYCTNACPNYPKSMHGRPTVVAEDNIDAAIQLLNEHFPARSEALEDMPYHGSCEFRIGYDGTVRVLPEFDNPQPPCKYHSEA